MQRVIAFPLCSSRSGYLIHYSLFQLCLIVFTPLLLILSFYPLHRHLIMYPTHLTLCSHLITLILLFYRYIIVSKIDVTDIQIFDMKCTKLLGAILSVFAHKVVLCQNYFEVSCNIKWKESIYSVLYCHLICIHYINISLLCVICFKYLGIKRSVLHKGWNIFIKKCKFILFIKNYRVTFNVYAYIYFFN